ncbi:Mss4-like protein [Coniochaeta sp. 2T2.1]|nr:Mss4-like protein [Coniochaeta sp. 2T2.1]
MAQRSANALKVECQCGAVSFNTPTPKPIAVFHCHCSHCRRQSSSAFGTSAIFPADGLFPLSQELRSKLGLWTRPSKEGRTMDCYFCKECGVRIMHRIREADGRERPTVSIRGGIVEGLDWSVGEHIYVEDAVVPLPESVVKHRRSPSPEKMALPSSKE